MIAEAERAQTCHLLDASFWTTSACAILPICRPRPMRNERYCTYRMTVARELLDAGTCGRGSERGQRLRHA